MHEDPNDIATTRDEPASTPAPAPAPAPAVGYGRPPIHTRFPPGRSGNPKGRAKGARGLKTEVLEMLNTPVIVREGGRKRKISTQRAVLARLREQSLKGEARAIEKLLQLAALHNPGELEQITSALLLEEDQAMINAFLQSHPRSS